MRVRIGRGDTRKCLDQFLAFEEPYGFTDDDVMCTSCHMKVLTILIMLISSSGLIRYLHYRFAI